MEFLRIKVHINQRIRKNRKNIIFLDEIIKINLFELLSIRCHFRRKFGKYRKIRNAWILVRKIAIRKCKNSGLENLHVC